jgi:ADP-ribose pyrophosphatase
MSDEQMKPPRRPVEADVKVLHEGEFLRLLRREHWEYVVRPNSSGAGFVVAVTDAGELVLVEQYRWPIRARSIELPAGIIGDSVEFVGEDACSSGLRELEEETGFRGESAELITSAPTAAGLTAETSYFVRARKLTRVHAGGGVDGEDITVHCIPVEQVDDWLDLQRATGISVDTRIYAALHFLAREARRKA